MRLSRFTAATVAAATATSLIVAAPAANAWETKYDRAADKCSISFSDRDITRVNQAYKALFTEMANQTDNEKLKASFQNAAQRPFFTDADKTLIMSPDEALEKGGLLYGVDIAQIVFPQGIEAALKDLDLEKIAANIDFEAVLADVDFEAVANAADVKKAVEDAGGVDVQAALKTLPIGEVLENVDWSKVEADFNDAQMREDLKAKIPNRGFSEYFGLIGDFIADPIKAVLKVMGFEEAGFKGILELVAKNLEVKNVDKAFSEALEKADVDTQAVLKEALEASGLDIKAVLKNLMSQPAVKAELKKQTDKIDFGKALKDALEKSGIELNVETILGFKTSEVSLAAQDAFDAVGPQVLAPIVTMNDAFTACSVHSDQVKKKPSGSTVGSSGRKQGSSDDHVKGSVASGSSLDMTGLTVVSILGVIAALLATGGAGFAARPIVENFMK